MARVAGDSGEWTDVRLHAATAKGSAWLARCLIPSVLCGPPAELFDRGSLKAIATDLGDENQLALFVEWDHGAH